eukprot:TRINITY_DN14018_c0_g1_i1.p3 TRINITY_DN14018_c0_g1~~TRINITY_DN14018_c0_g1_i1.p3  ORF type:complete len:104 (-),score=8.47 TRINITY_DN14018_c0_g1_i1:62-373(-)
MRKTFIPALLLGLAAVAVAVPPAAEASQSKARKTSKSAPAAKAAKPVKASTSKPATASKPKVISQNVRNSNVRRASAVPADFGEAQRLAVQEKRTEKKKKKWT